VSLLFDRAHAAANVILKRLTNLAKYTFSVARGFSRFYQRDENRILAEKDDVRRAVLIAVTRIVRSQLTTALSILGINVPEQM